MPTCPICKREIDRLHTDYQIDLVWYKKRWTLDIIDRTVIVCPKCYEELETIELEMLGVPLNLRQGINIANKLNNDENANIIAQSLMKRLKRVTAYAYGFKLRGDKVLSQLTNGELQDMLDDLFENALATGEFKKLGKEQHSKQDC